jgi:hypothetical protein
MVRILPLVCVLLAACSGKSGAGDSGPTDGSDGSDGEEPVDLAAVRALVVDWFEADTTAGPRSADYGLPDGMTLDARGADREAVPADVLRRFDCLDRLDDSDTRATRLELGRIEGREFYVLTVTTDDEDAYVEVFLVDGSWVAGARFHGTEAPVWDSFDGRVHLAERWTTLDGFSYEDGMSEADERISEGQVPLGWTGDVQLTSGELSQAGSLLGTVDFDGAVLSDDERAVAVAAFDLLWERHLQYTASSAGTVQLGSSAQGVLTVGTFTRPTDGLSYTAADWRDIDDGSFVFYFQLGTCGPELKTLQYDN